MTGTFVPFAVLWILIGMATLACSFFQFLEHDIDAQDFARRVGLVAALPLFATLFLLRGVILAVRRYGNFWA